MLTIGSRRIVLAVFLAALLALVAATAAHAHPTFRSLAWARIANADGDTVSAAILNQGDEGVRVFAWARGLAPGEHGIHIHAVGRCDDAAFASAGSHFNPEMKKHGLSNPEGPHAGDLPNLEVKDGGLGILRVTTDRVSLGEGRICSSTRTVPRSSFTPPRTIR